MARSRRVLHAALEDSVTPPDALTATQSLARVVQAEGNSLYTCQLPAAAAKALGAPDSGKVLVELNARFRNTVYMRRGGYVVVDLQSADERKEAGRRVVGEIINVVRDERTWRKQKYWPAEFAKSSQHDDDDDDEDESNVGKMPPSDSEEEQ